MLISRKSIKLTPLSLPDQSSFELQAVKLCGSTLTVIAVLYRPPKSSKNFVTELSTVLTTHSAMSPNTILMGD